MATYFIKIILALCCVLMLTPAWARMCTYSTWTWNVKLKKAVDYRTVRKPYRQLTANEMDKLSGCSVCREDQVKISLPTLKPFLVCQKMAGKVQSTLLNLLKQAQPINEVIGYRVGLTRGDVDADGNRTKFSNHSFGVALDINPKHNGLYTQCYRFGPACRLSRGGPWRPAQDPFSLSVTAPIVVQLKGIGLKWGGEIKGRQKDFMHFSLTGY